jgi:TDG/mug DNA glycosylase family protein
VFRFERRGVQHARHPASMETTRGAKPVNTRQILIAAGPPRPQRLRQIAPLIRQRASMDADLALRIAAPTSPPQSDAAPIAHLLPDVLADNLDVVFVGTAAGRRSSARGIYYAGAGNRFWPTLRQIELIPPRFAARDFAELMSIGIGFTDLCKTGCGMDRDVVVTPADIAVSDAKLRACQPRALAFTGKKAASLWLRRRTDRISYGRQKRPDFCEVFVLPSPSAAARRYWKVEPWQELADWLRATAPWRF